MKSITKIILCSTISLSPVVLAHSDHNDSDRHHYQHNKQQHYDSHYNNRDSRHHSFSRKKAKRQYSAHHNRHYKKRHMKHYKKQRRQHYSDRYSYPRNVFNFGHFTLKPYGFNQSHHHYHGYNICYSRH